MASPVYTVLFGQYYGTINQDAAIYDPPDTLQSVLRDIVVFNDSPAASKIDIYKLSGATRLFLAHFDVPAYGTDHLELRQVLETSEILHVTSNAAGWFVACTGYQLLLSSPPPAPGRLAPPVVTQA